MLKNLVLSFLSLISVSFENSTIMAEEEKEQSSVNNLIESIHQHLTIETQSKSIKIPTDSKSKQTQIKGNPKAARLAERLSRNIEEFEVFNQDGLSIQKSIVSIPGTSYRRFVVSIQATKEPVFIKKITFLNQLPFPNAQISGNTQGSVIVGDRWFCGIEHPMAYNNVFMNEENTPWTPQDFSEGYQIIPLPKDFNGGEVKLSFLYKKGPHRIDIESVQAENSDGSKIYVTDKHQGFSGVQQKNHIYTLSIPKEATQIRCIYKKTTETNSFGSIIINGLKSKNIPLISATLNRNFHLQPNEQWVFSMVVGSYKETQLRRDFQTYINHERAHPYRVFPHYNSWYDLGIFHSDNTDPLKRMTEEKVLHSMREFNKELFQKRGVSIESYLLDDGWDNWDSLWGYHHGFPNKFDVIDKEVKSQKSHIGAWLSPWGGYHSSKVKRVQNAQKMGLETPNNSLSMAQPKYYQAFRDRCLQMIHDYDMNLFKFDGIGAGVMALGANDKIAPDLQGLLKLIKELRAAKPNLFVNCTVGTWPSPFWVHFADSIWRGGSDCAFSGPGPNRERWITYRDDIVYDRFASKCPLFPLNSVMSHGIIVGSRSVPGQMKVSDSEEDTRAFANEVWMAMGCGTDLQEYYITPSMMSSKWWDILADGIKWLKANEPTLLDTHWVGGKPNHGNVYGYASFNFKLRKGIIILRNPTLKNQSFTINFKKVFELPLHFSLTLPTTKLIYSSTDKNCDLPNSKEDYQITLPPLEVKLFEFQF